MRRPLLRSPALLLAFLLLGFRLAAQAGPDVSALPARSSPQWVRDAVVYEVNERTFSPSGTFNGITARLDSLRAVGVTVLWLMPIHPIGQLKKKGDIGSPYAVRDYYQVNPAFGTVADFKRLVTEAHQRGMKVLIDIVANHTAWDNTMMSNKAYYRQDARGNVVSPYDWTDVAALNYANPALRKYMIDMMTYWLRGFDLDGFRCDAAGEVPTDFWDEARAALEKVKPDIMMLAEASKPELLVKAFDVDYAWPFYHTMASVIKDGQSASTIRATWDTERAQFPKGALHLRFTENHDEKRAIARFGERGAVAAAALVLTMDGVPLLYNGQEAGDVTESGAPALFERLPVFWQGVERRPEIPGFFHQMIALRREHPALRQGTLQWLRNSDDDRVVTFARGDGHEQFIIAVNLTNRPFTGTVQTTGTYTDVTPAIGPDSARSGALPALSLPAWGFRIFRRE